MQAKSSFKESTKEHGVLRTKIKTLLDRVDKFDEFVAESSQTIKVRLFQLMFLNCSSWFYFTVQN